MRRALLFAACALCACAFDKQGTASDLGLGSSDVGVDALAVDTSVDTSVVVDGGADVPVATDTFVPEGATDAVTDSGVTCKAPKGDLAPCTSIPSYEALATGQVLDGKADDFCDLPFVDFDNTKGAIKAPDPIPGGANVITRIRVAWSSYGLHAHLSVKDDKPFVYPGTDGLLWQGDSVEIYAAGTDALTGSFDGTSKDRGAQQIVFAPPNGSTPTRAQYFYVGTPGGSPPALLWAARLTTSGYDVELRIPWADLQASAVAAGRKIALTFAMNNKYDATKAQAFSTFQVKSPLPSPSTCTSGVQAYCDDRVWCTPTLAGPP